MGSIEIHDAKKRALPRNLIGLIGAFVAISSAIAGTAIHSDIEKEISSIQISAKDSHLVSREETMDQLQKKDALTVYGSFMITALGVVFAANALGKNIEYIRKQNEK